MDYFIVLGILVLQLGSWAGMYGLVKFGLINASANKDLMFAGGYAMWAMMGLLTYLLFRRGYRHVDPLIYVFGFFSWSTLTKLGTALELDGIIPKVLSPLVVEYLPCLKSAQGVAYLYWDGVVNTLLALACIAIYTCRKSHREVGLYWVGSVLNGAAVMIPVCLTGKDAIKWPLLVDMHLVFIPILAVFNMVHNRPSQARTFLKFPQIWKRPVDLLFFILFSILMMIVYYRSMAVQGGNLSIMKTYLKSVEPNLAGSKFQLLTYDYLYGLYYMFVMYSLWCPGQHWMGDFALIMAGGAAQAQVTYIASSLNSRTAKGLRPPTEGKEAVIFWAVNVLLFVVPQLFVWWTQRDTEHFGYTHTVDIASPIRRRVFRIKETRETVTTVTPIIQSDKADKKDD